MTLCPSGFMNLTAPTSADVADVVMTSDCSQSDVKVVNKHRFGAKVNGIIKIYLNNVRNRLN